MAEATFYDFSGCGLWRLASFLVTHGLHYLAKNVGDQGVAREVEEPLVLGVVPAEGQVSWTHRTH